ncbi:hypothetical protein C4D60_Mb09t09330 [Musa balbisiana]|uniref:histidinol dehydrogenase n=1 Tax=Musa balbisiana TaxID=52838 RepID=A0A4V4H344_MUSBA|nr:hypothetical protein C4D60_Mb09t09330 [Musa balbisiana]
MVNIGIEVQRTWRSRGCIGRSHSTTNKWKQNKNRPDSHNHDPSSRVRSGSGFPSVATALVEPVVIGSASELLHYCRGFKNYDGHTLSPRHGLSRPTSLPRKHGPDSHVVLVVAGDGVDIDAIQAEVSNQCASLPRGEYASKALSHSFVVFARDMVEAISFSNLYAPEHLIINVRMRKGSVFLGQWTPESVGDYASGTNHVLPTYEYARMYSGSLTEEGLKNIGPHVAKMAEVEGLEAHKRAVTLRLQEIEAALPA